MKRSEMIKDLTKLLKTWEDCAMDGMVANDVLDFLEAKGMTPPRTSEENVQAILSIYYSGYSTHQWDEDIEKDEKVMEAKKKREIAQEKRAINSMQRKINKEQKNDAK